MIGLDDRTTTTVPHGLRPLHGALERSPFDLAAAAESLRDLLAAGVLAGIVNEKLKELTAFTALPVAPQSRDRIRLFRSPQLRIDATQLRAGDADRPFVAMMTRHTVVGNAGRAPLRLRRFHQPRPEPHDVFDPTRKLERLGDVVLGPGEAVAFAAVVDAFSAHADGPTAMITAAGPHRTALRWYYDIRSLRQVRSSPTDDSWLRIRELLRLADVVGDDSIVSTVRTLQDHPSHFVRWAALRTVMRLSRDEGRVCLREAANDPHPQLRSAAASMLSGGDVSWPSR